MGCCHQFGASGQIAISGSADVLVGMNKQNRRRGRRLFNALIVNIRFSLCSLWQMFFLRKTSII